jgi:hypothetical protein
MKTKNIIPLLAVAFNAALFSLLIHYWLADWYAARMDISPRMAEWYMLTFTGLYFGVRGLLIFLNKDAVTKKIDRWLEDKLDK